MSGEKIMLEVYSLDSEPKTEFQLLIHFQLPRWLSEVPFSGYEKQTQEYIKFCKDYPDFFDKARQGINWLSTNTFFSEKIQNLERILKAKHIDIHTPFPKESEPYIQEITQKITDQLQRGLLLTFMGAIEFNKQQTNVISIKNISSIFYFKDIHFSPKDFETEKNKLINIINNLSKNLIKQSQNKRPLVEFFSSDLQRINKRLTPINQKNIYFFDDYQISEQLKSNILNACEITADQKKLLLDYQDFLENEKKSLKNLMSDEQIKNLFNQLLDKMQHTEANLMATLATALELEPLLKLKEPLNNIIQDLKNLRKEIKISSPLMDIDELENTLQQIALILDHPTFFQLTPLDPKRIPVPLIALFLNTIKTLGTNLAQTLASFQLSQIGLVGVENPITLVFLNNTTVKEHLQSCSEHSRVVYKKIESSNIVKSIQKLLELMSPIGSNVIESIGERKTVDEHYREIQHDTNICVDISDLNVLPSKKPPISAIIIAQHPPVVQVTPTMLKETTLRLKKTTPIEHEFPKKQIGSIPEYVPSIVPAIQSQQQSLFTRPFIITETKKSDSDDETLTTQGGSSSDYSSDEEDKEKKGLIQLKSSIATSPFQQPSLFYHPISEISNHRQNEALLEASQHFLRTTIQSASRRKEELITSGMHLCYNILQFFDAFIQEQEKLLHSLNEKIDAFSLIEVAEEILENQDFGKWFRINKNLIASTTLQGWLKEFIDHPTYKESRKNLQVALNAIKEPSKISSQSI